MTTIEQLIEQVTFLLEQHRKGHQECLQEFGSLLEFLDSKVKQEKDEENRKVISSVYATLKKQNDSLDENMRKDIAFLQEQQTMFNQVAANTDPARKTELLKLIMEDVGEVQSTEAFKKEILADAAESKKSLHDMIADIRQTLEEGGAAELEMLFEAMEEAAAANSDEDDDTDTCCQNRCDENEDGDDMCCELESECCDDESCDDESCGDDAEDDACGDECGSECEDSCSKNNDNINIFEQLDLENSNAVPEDNLCSNPKKADGETCCKGGDCKCSGICKCSSKR